MTAKVFFDANVYFCAAKSPLGGSGLLVEFVKRKKLELFTTPEILKEAEKNLRLKEDLGVLVRYYENFKFARPKIIKIDRVRAKKKFGKIINEKDTLVLAGAQGAKVNYLVTLDKKHFFTEKLKSAGLSFEIVTPGQLIRIMSGG